MDISNSATVFFEKMLEKETDWKYGKHIVFI